jgi:hypothetical protein
MEEYARRHGTEKGFTLKEVENGLQSMLHEKRQALCGISWDDVIDMFIVSSTQKSSLNNNSSSHKSSSRGRNPILNSSATGSSFLMNNTQPMAHQGSRNQPPTNLYTSGGLNTGGSFQYDVGGSSSSIFKKPTTIRGNKFT